MRFRLFILGAVGLSALGLSGCANAPGRPVEAEAPIVPNEISDFNVLYGQNCAGCHGSVGKGGAAIALANPVYLAIADDVILRERRRMEFPDVNACVCRERWRHAHR